MEISPWSWLLSFFSPPELLYLSTPHTHCSGKPLKSLGSSIDYGIKVLSSMATDPEGWNEHQTILALSPSPSVSAFPPSLELSPIMLGHQFCPLHSQSLRCHLYSEAVHALRSWHSFQNRMVQIKTILHACVWILMPAVYHWFDILRYINFALNCCRYNKDLGCSTDKDSTLQP